MPSSIVFLLLHFKIGIHGWIPGLIRKIDEGVKRIVNSIKDTAAFQQKVKPVYEKFRPSIGDDIYGLVMGQM
jgi:hypothetical protein